jgi:hypothetical protein
MKKAAQGKAKQPAATITVEWGDDNHSITLTPKNWATVKSGAPLSLSGKGYHYEGGFFWDYWHFAGGLEGDIEVGYGNDGGQGFVGTLEHAQIEEHEYTPKRRAS